MTTIRFFRLALLLPLIFGLIPLALTPAFLLFGVLPYLLIAVPAYFALGYAKSLERIVTISFVMPVAMFVLLLFLDIGLGAMGLAIAVAFVAVAWLLYGIARMAGWVLAMPPNTSLERTRER